MPCFRAGGGFRIGNPLANVALFELLLHMWETMWEDGQPSSPAKPPPALRTSSRQPSLSKGRPQQSGGSGSRVRFMDGAGNVAPALSTPGVEEAPVVHSGRLPRPVRCYAAVQSSTHHARSGVHGRASGSFRGTFLLPAEPALAGCQ